MNKNTLCLYLKAHTILHLVMYNTSHHYYTVLQDSREDIDKFQKIYMICTLYTEHFQIHLKNRDV